ncbi:MAG TPA: Rieske (2Fe-2S) protein [Blastocatellia bacterium]|nr:Rieske (2Fe-2S) protein [Blastocatellia bacterium]
MPEFVKVLNISDLPAGEARVVEVDGRQIALFNANGRFYALDNICAHRGGPLGEGFVDQNNLTVQCPWHGWVYGLSNGTSQINPLARVECFEVLVEGDDLKVALD